MARFFDIIPRLNRSQLNRDLRRLQSEQHNINVNANVNGQGNVDNLNEHMHHLNSTGRDSSKIFSDLRIKMGAYLAITKAVADAVRGSINTIKSYDDYTTDLSMAMGSSREEAEKYLATLSQKGKELKATVGEMAEGANDIIRSGKSVEETETLLKDSMILSKVAKMDSADATDALITVMNSYRKETEEVINTVDALCSVDLVSASSANGLAISLGKSASAANMAGVEINKLIAMLAVMKEAAPMESDQTIGNAMKSILSRMNQVKAGKFIDEETGESLNDVEKVLSKVGIAMRDANGQFIESEKILDEVGQKWSTFDSVTQRAISTAIAGSYQYNRFISLMDGYSKVLKYTEVAQNSSGQAMEKFQNYEESLEAKTKLLQNSLESLAYDTFGNEFYGSVLDATTGLIQFAEKTEAVKTGLTILGIVGGAKIFATIATSIVGAVKHLNDFNTALSIIKNGNVASSFGTLLACTEGLNASQLKLILSSQALTNEQRVAILVRRGYTEEEIAATIATLNLANAEGVATGATATLTGTVKGLGASLKALAVAHPVMAVLTALGLAVYGSVKAYDALTLSVEEANEALEESLSQYEESKSELESLTSELESQKKAMDDLLAKDKLTYAEQGQLEELQEITKELLLQKDIAERKAESDAKQVAKDTVQAYKTQYGKFDISEDEINKKIASMEASGGLTSSNENNISGKLAELENLKRIIAETEQQLANTGDLSEQEIKVLENDYQDYLDLYEKTEGQVSDALADLEEKRQALADGYQLALEKQNNGETLSTTEKESIETYNEIADAMRLIYQYTNPNAWNTIEISKIFNTEGLAETKEELIALAKAGTLSPTTLASYTALNDAIEESDLMLKEGQTAYSALCDEIYALAEAQEDAAETFEENPIEIDLGISSTIDRLNTQLKPTFDALKDAYQDIFKSEDGEIKFSLDDVDISTFESIKSAIDDLNEIEGVDVNYGDFEDFVKVLSDTSSTSEEVQDQFDKLATSIVYSSDCTEMSKDNFDLLCKSLYEMGLTNAPEVLRNIRTAQEELKASGIDLKNVTLEEANAFINEAEASDLAKKYLRMYMIQVELANNNQLDTSESIQNLKNLVTQLGMTCNALGKTSEMMQAVLSLESATNAISAGVDPGGTYTRQAEAAKQKIAELANGGGEDFNFNFNSNVTSPSKDKSSKDSSSKPSEVKKEFDWIEKYLETFARRTEKIMNRISDYLSFKKNISTIKSAIKSVRSELSANEQALAEYAKQMNAIGLDAKYVEKIKNGALEIETITGYETDGVKDANAQLIEKIEKYQDLYDKYTEIEDKIEELRDTEKEWLVKNLEYINEYYQKLSDIKNLAIDKKQDNIDLKEAQGKKVTTSDYSKLVSYNEDYIKSLRTTYKKTNAEFNKLVKNGTIEKNSAEWFEWKETLADLNSEIVQAQINTAEWKDEIEDLKIQKYTDAIDKLKIKNEELNDAISEREAIGLDVREKDYSAVVKNNNKQISQLEKQNALLYKYQSQVQKGSERWKEFQEQIDSNNTSIRQLNQSTTELIKNIANIPIEERDEDLEDSSNRLALLQKKYDNATSLQERKQILKLMEEEQKKQKEINEQAKNATKSNLSTSQNNLLSYKNNQQSIVQKAEEDVKFHETYISSKEKELDVLNKQEKSLNSKISALDKKIAKTKDKTLLKQLKKQKEKYENQLNSTKVQQNAISSDLELAKKDLAKSKEELATAQKNVSALSGFKEGEKMDTDGITDKDTLKMIKEYNLALEAYEQAEYDCAIADEEWTNQMRENAQNRLDIIKEEYKALIDLTNSYSDATNSLIDMRKLQGNVVGDELYESLINNSQKNVEFAYEEWQKHSKQMAENDYTNDPEGYQKALAENNRLQQAWYDSVKTAEEQLDNLMNTRIEALEEEKEKLQELHDLQERRYKLEEAKYNLEKAKQKTNLVYNGTEFVYQADTNAVKEAEKALEDAEYDELINKIEDWIKSIEDAKEDINLYDADGNPLTNTDEIIEAAKAFGDNLLEGLSKLLENNGYTSGDLSKIQKFAEGGIVGKSDDDKFKAIAKSLGEDNLVAVKDGEMVLTKLQSNELYKKLVGTGTIPVPILDLKPVIPDNLVRVNTAPNIEVNLTGDMQFNEVQNVSDLSKAIVNGQLRGAIKQGLGRLKM